MVQHGVGNRPNPFAEPVATESIATGLARTRAHQSLALSIAGARYPIHRSLTVGSAPGADVTLPAKGVSRLHARIEPGADGVWLVDLGSTNGTFVDGVRVTGAMLVDGARVRFGSLDGSVSADRPVEVRLWPTDRFGAVLGRSGAMRELFELLSRVAPSDATVLVRGETGTGKELVARALHDS